MSALVQRQTNLPAHIIQFARYLRKEGFQVGTSEEEELLLILNLQIPKNEVDFQSVLKSIFVKSRKQYLAFNELYIKYWEMLSRAEDAKVKDIPDHRKGYKKPTPQKSLQALKSWLHSGRMDEEESIANYSAFEAIGKKDFAHFSEEDQYELRQILSLLAKKLSNKYNRRYVKSKKSHDVDLKHTVRESMSLGGEIARFYYRKQKIKKCHLILICDVSKSMELYSQFLIHFMYSFHQIRFRISTFVFSTRLTHLSAILRDGNFDQVVANLPDEVPDWSGGTRIGSSLNQLCINYGSKILKKDTIVMILSDGWDTGDLDLLESNMSFLKRKVDKIIWLNPLAGNPAYEPSTGGMKVAMPYIDTFSSAHNLESLKDVVRFL